MSKITKAYLNELTYQINAACIEVHKILGPGLMESVYHKCLEQEFLLRGIKAVSEQKISLHYKGIDVDTDFRCDFLIEGIIILEIKSVEKLLPIHQSQLLTYMSLIQKPKGILVNFNVTNLMQEGQQTLVNQYFRKLPE
jgi:GxxExxY protein